MTRVGVCMALTSIALLGACVGRNRAVPPSTVVQTVDRPVAVSCLKPGQRPTPPRKLTEDLPVPPSTLTEMVGRFRAKLTEWAEYGRTADSLLRICETVPAAKGDVK